MYRRSGLLHIVFGLGMITNDDTWTWFIRRLKDRLRDVQEVEFISDMSNSIDLNLSIVFPDSYHGYCCRHVAKNLWTKIGCNIVVLANM